MKVALQAKQASTELLSIPEDKRNQALLSIAAKLREQSQQILVENQIDIKNAQQAGLSAAMIDRLSLSEESILAMAESVESIAEQDQVVNAIVEEIVREDGLKLQKQRIPIGVLAMIFESRPNVVIDCSALAIKSGNAIILKGGKEVQRSNLILANLVIDAISNFLPEYSVQLVSTRDDVHELIQQVGSIDLVIPRGGEGLIRSVTENSKVPVLAHFKGLCHVFVDASANETQAKDIILNAKVQRPGVCNAMETLLIHADKSEDFIRVIFAALEDEDVDLRLCERCPKTDSSIDATDEDWDTEYLDKILSVKIVDDVAAACEHIKRHGSKHTEAILSADEQARFYFQQNVDASSVMLNASTRFNDGGEYMLGAELGISTTKLHAYGPMGAKEMTITRHLVVGDGHFRK